MENFPGIGLCSSQKTCTFKTLKSFCRSNIDFFQNDQNTNAQRFVTAFTLLLEHLDKVQPVLDGLQRIAYNFDLDEQTQGNGYRSLIDTVNSCVNKILNVSRQIYANRNSFLFRGSYYCKEIEAYTTVLGTLRACLHYAQKLLSWSKQGEIFPEGGHFPEELLAEAETLNQQCFYGRCLGFQYCSSMHKPLQTVAIAMASFSEGFAKHDGMLARAATSLLNSGKYLMNPELRATQIIQVTQNTDIHFCKAFWSITETDIMHQIPGLVCPSLQVNKVVTISSEPLDLPRVDGEGRVTVQPPSAHKGPAPVFARLLCNEIREGQTMDRRVSIREGEPDFFTYHKVAPLSPGLIIHCHGGGFVAQSSKSHEVYLRHWAKDLQVPILSIDYSLSPENPFPRALEEVVFSYCWALRYCQQLGSTGERICFVGDSAGGNLLVAATLKLSTMGVRLPDGIVVAYTPFLINFTPSPSRLLCLMDPLLPIGILVRCLAAYAGITDPYEQPPPDFKSSTSNTPISSTQSSPKLDKKKVLDPATTQNISGQNHSEISSENKDATLEEPKKSSSISRVAETGLLICDYCKKNLPLPLISKENSETMVGESDNFCNCNSVCNSPKSLADRLQFSVEVLSRRIYEEELNETEMTPISDKTDHKISNSVDKNLGRSESLESEEYVLFEIPRSVTQPNLSQKVTKATNRFMSGVMNLVTSAKDACTTNKASEKSTTPSNPINVPSSEMRDKNRPSKLKINSGATPPFYAMERHFAQSPLLRLKLIQIDKNAYMSPLEASDELLKGMPPLYLVACLLDPILDDSVMFAKRLRSLGKTVHLDIVQKLPHGFLNFTLVSKDAQEGSNLCISRIKEALWKDYNADPLISNIPKSARAASIPSTVENRHPFVRRLSNTNIPASSHGNIFGNHVPPTKVTLESTVENQNNVILSKTATDHVNKKLLHRTKGGRCSVIEKSGENEPNANLDQY